MLEEIKRIIIKLDNKYRKYFNQFVYFSIIKKLIITLTLKLYLKEKNISNKLHKTLKPSKGYIGSILKYII